MDKDLQFEPDPSTLLEKVYHLHFLMPTPIFLQKFSG